MTTPRRFHRVREVLDRRQPDLTVLLENVDVPRNLAAILRSCDAAGNRKWVPVRKHRTLADALAALRVRGLRILAAPPAPGAVPFREVDYTQPIAVLLGNEDNGVSEEALAAADEQVIIPMSGMGTSLNVSVAAALLLFEAQRQRLAAGLYDRPRLDPESYRTTLFEWAWPNLAALCRKRGVPYPELGEDGEILGPLP